MRRSKERTYRLRLQRKRILLNHVGLFIYAEFMQKEEEISDKGILKIFLKFLQELIFLRTVTNHLKSQNK